MRKVLIAQSDPENATAAARVRVLCNELARTSPHLELDPVQVAPGVVFSLLERGADAVLAVGFGPRDLAGIAVIGLPIVWDMALITAADVAGWLDDPAARAGATAAMAAARAYVDISAETALAIEDAFNVGISSHGVGAALAAAARPMVVAMGTGLGNMIYAVPALRWLSERHNVPVDLVIHDKFDEGVTLFARAPWINAVYPGYEYLVGRSYDLFISGVTAGPMRPPVSARQFLFLDREYDYNEEGRFIHETRLNFLGLERLFGEDPGLRPDLPLPFLRDIRYRHGGKRIVGIANGKKSALWAKREWAQMEALTARLVRDGWEVRSFGLPAEYVAGARDFTGIPLRDILHGIAECSYFISYDGGIAHMAEGMGVPTIWLFGSTGTVKNGPVYGHGRVLLSERSCGPCLYKHDWIRCTTPACMSDITLEDVVAALYALEAEITASGYSQAPARPDPRLLRYEIDALHRPGPADLWQDYLTERTALLPRNEQDMLMIILGLIAAGDVYGATALARAQAAEGKGGAVNLFVRHALARAHQGPSPVDGLVPGALPSLTEQDLNEVINVAFPRDTRRVILNLGIKLFADRQDRDMAVAFLAAANRSAFFSQEIGRNIHRAIERFATRDQPETTTILAAVFESNPSLRRMRLVRSIPVAARLREAAAQHAAQLSMESDDVLRHGLTPHLAAITAPTPDLRLDLGDHVLSLAHRSTVLVLVPHVMVKNALPGSSSGLLLLHLQRLAASGLRPVVVTVGYDNIPEGVITRDSVTFVQGHRVWPATEWAEVVRCFSPSTCLAYGGVEQDLDLPGAMRDGLLCIALDGLCDQNGYFVEFTPTEQWAPLPDAPAPDGTTGISANVLTAQLFVPPPRQRPVPPGSLKALVLLHDSRDFAALLRLATVMPSVRFTVLTGLMHRGIEKNLTCVPPGEYPQDGWAEAGILIQFSTRPATLAAEAIVWIERGGRAIARPAGLPAGPLADALTTVGGGADTMDWVEAIRTEAAGLAARNTMLLVD